MKILNLLFISGLVIILGSCMSTSNLPKPAQFPKFVKGAVVVGNYGEKDDRFKGELLALENDSIVLLSFQYPYDKEEIITYPIKGISQARLRIASISNMPGGLIGWSILLLPWTLSHGWIAVLSFPVNTINLIAVSISLSTSYFTLKIPDDIHWEESKMFARFPQGWPRGLNKNGLLEK